MTSYVENETSVEFDFDTKEILDAVMGQVLLTENCPYEAQVNLLITDEKGIHQFNRDYRQIDAPTDVLS
ncbi:MAG: rRNA maturation RNAse YbeY, partial [Lachnospiraceae bacterium]|nr:rRNA maturation RNAse YbeY [Lachnospiraceae bacterium]